MAPLALSSAARTYCVVPARLFNSEGGLEKNHNLEEDHHVVQ